MAKPKKTALAPEVGPLDAGKKRGNPNFVSSSFYVPKRINLNFDKSLLTLKAEGLELDRSDILSALMDRFSAAVKAAEAKAEADGGEIDLQAVLEQDAAAGAGDLGEVSALKNQMRSSVDQLKADHREMMAKADQLNELWVERIDQSDVPTQQLVEGQKADLEAYKAQLDEQNQKVLAVTRSLIESMLKDVPDDRRAEYQGAVDLLKMQMPS